MCGNQELLFLDINESEKLYSAACMNISEGDSKRWTQFCTGIFPELYIVFE
jgi:hypothetical protein